MELQKMWPLVVILIILVTAGIFKDSQPKRSLQTEAGFKKLIEKTFAAQDVQKLTITMGTEVTPAIEMTRNTDKEWIINSLFNVKGNEYITNTFIDKIKRLSGEFRSSKKELLNAFALNSENAMTVTCEGKNNEVLAKILAGKNAGPNMSFVRLPESSSVFTVAADFRKELKVSDEDISTPPESKHFMEKSFAKLKSDKVLNVSLNLAGKELEFNRVAVAAEIENKEEDNDTAKKKQTTKWIVKKGPEGLNLKKGAVEEMLNGLNSLSGTDVMNPTTPAKWGLDNPEYQIFATEDGNIEPISIIAHQEDSDVYVSTDNVKSIYKLTKWNFEKALPKTSKLFNFPSAGLEEIKVKNITVKKDNSEFTITKIKKESVVTWSLSQPLVVEADEEKVIKAARGIFNFNLTDFAIDSKREELGLTTPAGTITCTMEDGSKVIISIGNEEDGNRFVELSSMKGIFAASASDINDAFLTLDEIKKEEE